MYPLSSNQYHLLSDSRTAQSVHCIEVYKYQVQLLGGSFDDGVVEESDNDMLLKGLKVYSKWMLVFCFMLGHCNSLRET